MVLLHIKRGDASQFLYETTVSINVGKLSQEIAAIYNGRSKIRRVCAGKSFMRPNQLSTQLPTDSNLQKLKSLPTTAVCCRQRLLD